MHVYINLNHIQRCAWPTDTSQLLQYVGVKVFKTWHFFCISFKVLFRC